MNVYREEILMANKPQAQRQKLVFRLEPAQLKPRNTVVATAPVTGAGSHAKTPAMLRKKLKQDLKKLPLDKDLD